jgi:LmbE family N-acetylglucosaminyl deacetylase
MIRMTMSRNPTATYADRVYLSPHLDDAALSCGGTMFAQTRAGRSVSVVNVFAGVPDYADLSAFARAKHAVWGDPEDVVAARRIEDRCAQQILGVDSVDWDHLDAIYRTVGQRVLYPNEAAIFGELDTAESDLGWQLADEIDARLADYDATRIYAPLGIGHHVDHLVVRSAGLVLRACGWDVLFYEDFPYVWRNDLAATPIPAALDDLGDWQSVVQAIDVERKIKAIACYESQVGDLFGDVETMARAVRDHATDVGHGYPAERSWRLVR